MDGQTIEYRGVELQISHVSDLILSEYQQAYTLLYDELLFKAKDLIPMESGRRIILQDWRHGTIAISKKLARNQGLAKADFEDIGDKDTENYKVPDNLTACHTGHTVVNYSITIDVLKRLTAESLEVFGQVSYR